MFFCLETLTKLGVYFTVVLLWNIHTRNLVHSYTYKTEKSPFFMRKKYYLRTEKEIVKENEI